MTSEIHWIIDPFQILQLTTNIDTAKILNHSGYNK